MIQNRSETQDEPGTDNGTAAAGDHDRITLVRDSLVFQFKLVVDGTRDLLLVPVSLVATVISLVWGPGKHGLDFYSVLRFGKRTEQWIDLFGAAESDPDPESDAGSLDAIVDALENQILDGAPREQLPSVVLDRLRKRPATGDEAEADGRED